MKSVIPLHLKPTLLILPLTFLAFVLRLYQLDGNSLWYDELLQLDIAQGPFSDILPHMNRHAAMPLDYFILNGWVHLGRQEFWVRWPALFFGTLAIPLLYRLGQQLFNSRVGLIAALLLSSSSFAIQYSQEVRPYALLLTLTLIGYLGLWVAYKSSQLWLWGVIFLGVLGAALTHYFALFTLLPMGLFVGIKQLYHFKSAKYWERTILFTLCLILIIVTMVLIGRFKPIYNVSFGIAGAASQPEQLLVPAAEKPNRGSGPPVETAFFVDKVFSILATSNPAILSLFTFFFLLPLLYLLFPAFQKRSQVLLLVGGVFVPILSIYLFLLYRGTFYAVRYILYTLPAYLLLVAYGLESSGRYLAALLSKSRARPIAYPSSINAWLGVFLLTFLAPLLWTKIEDLQTYYHTPAYEDWRAVGQLLEKYATPQDAVIAIRAEPTMNWYYPPAEATFGTYQRLPNVWQALNDHPRRWFVLSSYSRRRDKAVREWLQTNGGVAIGIDRRVILFVQQEGVSAKALLKEIKGYELPPNAMTYVVLARQLKQHGDLENSRVYFEKALELAAPDQKSMIRVQMASSFLSF